MPSFNLFPHERIIGVFRGFSEGGLEFHAQLVLPYRSDFQNIPMHGQFVLVQLETAEEAVLDRIEDGTYAVLLVDEQETEFVVPAEQLPDDATPGKWLRVRIEAGTITPSRSMRKPLRRRPRTSQASWTRCGSAAAGLVESSESSKQAA